MKKVKHNANQHRKNTEKTKLLYPELSYKVRGAIFEVYKELGPYHKEKVYGNALAEELKTRDIKFSRQKRVEIKYNNKKVGTYIPDFVIENKIIIELKAVKFVHKSAIKQLYHYLNGSKYRVGFLVNFKNSKKVKIIRRVK
jgi:GxxExxY protein